MVWWWLCFVLGASTWFKAHSSWQLPVKSSWWWTLLHLRRCVCWGGQTISRLSLCVAVQSKLWPHAWRLPWKVQGRCGMVWPQEEQPPCPGETWSTRRAPLLADGDGNGGCPFGTATILARPASLSSWCPSCGTLGSYPRWPGRSAEMQQGCSSFCDLRSAASRHGWVRPTQDWEGCPCKACSQAEAMCDWLQFLHLVAVFMCENGNMEIWGRTDHRWKQQSGLKGL